MEHPGWAGPHGKTAGPVLPHFQPLLPLTDNKQLQCLFQQVVEVTIYADQICGTRK